MSKILAISLTILPFYFMPGNIFVPYSYARDMLFLFLAVSLCLCGVRVDSRKNLPVFILLILSYFNQFQPMLTTVLLQYLPFLGGMLLILATNDAKIVEKDVKIAAIITAIFGTIYMSCTYFGYDPMDYFFNLTYIHEGKLTKTVMPIGNMAHPIPSAILVVSMVPFCLWLLPLAILMVWMSGSATALVALVVGSFTVLYPRVQLKYWIYCGLGLLPGLGWLYYLNFFEPSERLTKWAMIPGFVDNPIIGQGLGYFREMFWRVSGGAEKWFHAHNEVLELYAAFGIVGLLCFGYLLSLIRVNRQNIRYFACFMSLVASSMFYFTFHNSPLVLWAIVCYSVLTQRRNYEVNRSFSINR